MIRDRSQAIMRSRWFMPLFSLGLGVVVLGASWVGGQPGAGVYGLVVMAGFGLVLLLLAGRSETIRGLTVGRDERFAQIDLRATAVAGLALIITLIVTWLVQIARGHSGSPYDWLCAIGGLAYILAVAFFRWRS
ncbi:MAG TPA: hypothetical protein VH307_19735 [Streptosporangiaceae bacterium]|jgi:hypothetical protein|nr:hypothetical protein [Streptosporangiaceae bacterium]